MNKFLLFNLIIVMASCTANHTNGKTYWVNSLKVPCQGVGEQHCLQVQKGDTIDSQKWKLFYSSIKGFDYKAGYIYKLRVKEAKMSAENVPADHSSINYTLIDMLNKEKDAKVQLHDIWALERIQGKKINFSTGSNRPKQPQIEFNLSKMRVMGNNGCNNFTGNIKHIDSKKLILKQVATTQMACPDIDNADTFIHTLDKVKSYSLQNLKLTLSDKNGTELLQFKKVD